MKIFSGFYLLVIVAITNCSTNEKFESNRTKFVQNSKEKKDNLFFHSYVKKGKKKTSSTRATRPSFSIFVAHHQRDFYWNHETIPLGEIIDRVIIKTLNETLSNNTDKFGSKKLIKNSKVEPLSQTKMFKSKDSSSLKLKEITVHNSNRVFPKSKFDSPQKVAKKEKNHNMTKSSNTLVQDLEVNPSSRPKMVKVENSSLFKSEKMISNEVATPIRSGEIKNKNMSTTLIKDPKVQIGSQKQRNNLENLSRSKVAFSKVPNPQRTDHKIKNQRTNVTIKSTLGKLEDTKNTINQQFQTKSKNAKGELGQKLASLNVYLNKKSKILSLNKKIDKIQPLQVNVNNISKKHLSISDVFKKKKHPSTPWNVEKEVNESKKLLNAAKKKFHKVDDTFSDIMDDLESAFHKVSQPRKTAINVLDNLDDLAHENSSKKTNQELSDITLQKFVITRPPSPQTEKKKKWCDYSNN